MNRLAKFLLVYSLAATSAAVFFGLRWFSIKSTPSPIDLSPAISDLRSAASELRAAANQNTQLPQLLQELKDELIIFRADSRLNSPLQTNSGTLTVIHPQNQPVTVFSEPTITASSVGQAQSQKTYPYTDSQDNWYYIQLSSNLSGWIPSQFIQINP